MVSLGDWILDSVSECSAQLKHALLGFDVEVPLKSLFRLPMQELIKLNNDAYHKYHVSFEISGFEKKISPSLAIDLESGEVVSAGNFFFKKLNEAEVVHSVDDLQDGDILARTENKGIYLYLRDVVTKLIFIRNGRVRTVSAEKQDVFLQMYISSLLGYFFHYGKKLTRLPADQTGLLYSFPSEVMRYNEEKNFNYKVELSRAVIGQKRWKEEELCEPSFVISHSGDRAMGRIEVDFKNEMDYSLYPPDIFYGKDDENFYLFENRDRRVFDDESCVVYQMPWKVLLPLINGDGDVNEDMEEVREFQYKQDLMSWTKEKGIDTYYEISLSEKI